MMVDQLNGFAGEVTRMAREVGTEGKLGGQAQVPGVAGVWKDLTDNVNLLAANLTDPGAQHRRSDHRRGQRRLVEEDHRRRARRDPAAQGDHQLMVDQLNGFAGEVTRVAREVGTEGKLGGQAQVPGRRRHLEGPDRQRQHAGRQPDDPGARHRRGGDRGDQGRPDALDPGRRARARWRSSKDKLNTMIDNLRLTTERNTEQDWLKTNLAKFTNMLQGQRDLGTVGRLMLSELTPLVGAHQAVIYRLRTTRSDDRGCACSRSMPTPAAPASRGDPHRRGPDRPVRRRQAADPDLRHAGRRAADHARACSRPRPRASSCCRCCSRARSRR